MTPLPLYIRPFPRGLRGSKYLTLPSGTSSGAARWPGAGAGSVVTTAAASSLLGSPLSCIDRIIVPAAPLANGQFELRDPSGLTPIRFLLRALTTMNYPYTFPLGSGHGIKMALDGFSVAWVGDAAGVSPVVHVFYRNLVGLPEEV